MKIEIEVTEYTPESWIRLNWVSGYVIESRIDGNTVVLKANKEGLTTLAQHLLTLAQENIEPGNHIHLDDSNGLEDGSCELIIERT